MILNNWGEMFTNSGKPIVNEEPKTSVTVDDVQHMLDWRVALFDADDVKVWSGSLRSFLDDNTLELDELVELELVGHCKFGGGAAAESTLVVTRSWS